MIEQTKSTYAAELQRQELTAKCHALIAAIASRPGALKLLKGVLPTLQMYAQYKANRTNQRNKFKH